MGRPDPAIRRADLTIHRWPLADYPRRLGLPHPGCLVRPCSAEPDLVNLDAKRTRLEGSEVRGDEGPEFRRDRIVADRDAPAFLLPPCRWRYQANAVPESSAARLADPVSVRPLCGCASATRCARKDFESEPTHLHMKAAGRGLNGTRRGLKAT